MRISKDRIRLLEEYLACIMSDWCKTEEKKANVRECFVYFREMHEALMDAVEIVQNNCEYDPSNCECDGCKFLRRVGMK